MLTSLRDAEGEIHMARRTLYLPVLIAAAVAVACAVALSALSEKAEATFPGKNGRIAYASYDAPFPKGDSEIYTINPDGSGKTQLTNNNTDDLDPSYSPDGKKIVYAGQDGPKGDLEIYTINARGGDKFQVTNNDTDNETPSYSPSGKKIAYTDLNRAGPDIYTIKVGGGARA
jgi:dipeptidyl aminopeptidase/acylaminoacyl peptidase